MAKLVDKINTLIRSNVQGVFGSDPDRKQRRSTRKKLSGKDLQADVAALRARINDALDHEDRLIEESKAMQRQIDDWDQQADAALQKGDEATARHAIRQMQLQQQRLAMHEAELAEHKYATAELISQANEFEAFVAEAERQQAEAAQSAAAAAAPADAEADEALLSAGLGARTSAAAPAQAPKSPQPAAKPVVDDEQAVEDDLARRRKRLSL